MERSGSRVRRTSRAPKGGGNPGSTNIYAVTVQGQRWRRSRHHRYERLNVIMVLNVEEPGTVMLSNEQPKDGDRVNRYSGLILTAVNGYSYWP